ncbi:MAG TPA: hypothetical protein VER75_00770, partial [Thermoleophilaceae bacterium]|nr:hypothetical protein [Thermoleophilaceae bacterium]
VDNTTRRPQNPMNTNECPALDKSGCGTVPLRGSRRGALASVDRVDGHRISVDLHSQLFQRTTCGSGQMEFWSDHGYSGGVPTGELPVRMPSPSALKRRRVARASGTSQKRTSFHDPGDEATSDDVTRKATVTFTRR